MNSTLIVFLNLTQLAAMEAVPEGQQNVMPFLIAGRRAIALGVNALQSTPLPEEPTSWVDFEQLVRNKLATDYPNFAEEMYPLCSMLPQVLDDTFSVAMKGEETIRPPILPPPGLLTAEQIAQAKISQEARYIRTLTIMFQLLQIFYPEEILGTFQDFWNDGNLDEKI